LILLALLVSGCASVRSQGHAADGSLEIYTGKMRELSTRAKPSPSGAIAATLEGQDPDLKSALLELRQHPGAAQHVRVAERYRRLKILDVAHDHFERARQLDPTDAAAYEGLARIWRDWGFPNLGLGDASRAVYYAPSSATAQNTLGTVLTAMGRGADARRAYERALALDPRAAYVLNNLCYLSFLEGEIAAAVTECRAALDVDPGLAPARNNLALAYAADQRDDLAQREFLAASSVAAGWYNIGIVDLAEKRYARASNAFAVAQIQRPSWAAAGERARKARILALKAGGTSQQPRTD
jgi:Flp pilus assembly protein TadD